MKPGITMSAASRARSASAFCSAGDLRVERIDRVAHPELEVGGDLVVARAGGVQPAGRRADQFGEPALDVHMNVFERARVVERPRLDFAFDLGETARDGVGVGGLDDAGLGEHRDVGERAGDVLGRRAPRSKSMEALISSMISAGPVSNRPPHILLLMPGSP